jgi:hypothetical protein
MSDSDDTDRTLAFLGFRNLEGVTYLDVLVWRAQVVYRASRAKRPKWPPACVEQFKRDLAGTVADIVRLHERIPYRDR